MKSGVRRGVCAPGWRTWPRRPCGGGRRADTQVLGPRGGGSASPVPVGGQDARVRHDGPMPAKVLVVEDEDSVRLMLRLLLEDEGYRVVEASNGRQAVERVRSEAVDLVLLDLRLPEMGGFDVCRSIRVDNDVP